MEKISFGYTDSRLWDLLGSEIVNYRESIENISGNQPDIDVSASLIPCNLTPRLAIRLRGDLDGIERTMSEMFEEFGLPNVIRRPKLGLIRLFKGKNYGHTTRGGYDLIKTLFKKHKRKVNDGHVLLL